GLRRVAVEYGRVIAAGMSGKIKTASSILAICLMLTPWHSAPIIGAVTINTLCVAVMVLTTVWSGMEYFVQNWEVMNLKK
ncbi:MAG: CDP-alcohol phosphatidyltransferase family protein, partial [Oscillospiraceae bacterium]